MATNTEFVQVAGTVCVSGVPIVLGDWNFVSLEAVVEFTAPRSGYVIVDLGRRLAVLMVHAKGAPVSIREEEVTAFYRRVEPHLAGRFGRDKVSRMTHRHLSGLMVEL